jgi:protein arginine N-methyltransferase 7
LLPAFRHAAEKSLLLPDAVLIPNAATVYVMPVEWRVTSVCGLDVSAVNAYRHAPSHTSGTPFAPGAVQALAPPRPAWHFDFQNPPDASDSKTVDFAFARDGKWNAVVFWYELRLCEGVVLSTAPEEARHARAATSGEKVFFPSSLQAAGQYLLGEICVREGDVVPLTCAHNTVQMQFSVEEAEYAHLHKKVASFPQYHFEVLRDEARARAYDDAIRRRVRKAAKKKKKQSVAGGVSVLDIGAGSGLLAMMAARAGASKVVACEWHGALATCARRNVAANGLSKTVTVAAGDVAKLRRGKQGVPVDGFDVAVVDLFDAGLTGDHVLWMLEQARKHVLAPGAVVVPAAATMYCVGLEAYTAEVNGFDFSAFNKYRWDSTYRAAKLADEKDIRVLTKPKRVFEFFLQERDENGDTDGRFVGGASNRETVARLETVASGYLNAVAFWFDLHMDERETVTTAPPGYGKGGTVLFEETRFRNDPGGLRAAREARDEDAKREMEAAAARHAATLAANPRTHLGAEAFSKKDDRRVDDSTNAPRSRRRKKQKKLRRVKLRTPNARRTHTPAPSRRTASVRARSFPRARLPRTMTEKRRKAAQREALASAASTTGAKPCSTSSAAFRCAPQKGDTVGS